MLTNERNIILMIILIIRGDIFLPELLRIFFYPFDMLTPNDNVLCFVR